MSVTASPCPPSPALADALEALREEALIKEARRRARRRRQRYAAALAIATTIVGVGAALAMHAEGGAAHSSAAAQPLAPAALSATHSTMVFAKWNVRVDGSRVFFPTSQSTIKATLYTINADGTGLHQLLHGSQARLAGGWAAWPALSPDGRRVAFQTVSPAGTAIDVINRNGTGLRQIAALGEHAAWSPDGTKIAYSIWPKAEPQGIYVVRADGTARRRLTQGGGIYPSWSPDGTKIAYACRPPNGRDAASLCVMNADGTAQHQIARVGSAATPAWSPDGTKIAFTGGAGWIYTINANGTNLRQLQPVSGETCSPAWSPNGKQIAFTNQNGGRWLITSGIFLMNADGRNVVHLKGTSEACGITWR